METEELYTLVVNGEIANKGLLLHVAQKSVTEWSRVSPDALVEYRPDTPKIKILDLLPEFNFLDVASIIHCASEALRHSCGLARCYADLGLRILAIHDTQEDDGWMLDTIADVKDKHELVELIMLASYRLQTLAN